MSNTSNEEIVTSYLNLRRAIGILGLSLPILLWLGGWLVDNTSQATISHYYYSAMRNLLVGLLVTISIFLIAYRGYGKGDFWCPRIAGFAGLGVAFFPTLEMQKHCTTKLLTEFAETANNIHYGSAIVFFFSLAMVCLFFFTKSSGDMTAQKKQRNMVYRVCGVVILVCMIAIGTYFKVNEDNCPTTGAFPIVFILEAIAVWAFGLSWLVKSEAILSDKVGGD